MFLGTLSDDQENGSCFSKSWSLRHAGDKGRQFLPATCDHASQSGESLTGDSPCSTHTLMIMMIILRQAPLFTVCRELSSYKSAADPRSIFMRQRGVGVGGGYTD